MHVVDLGAAAVRDVEKPECYVVSVLSEKQNAKNENIVPESDSESPKSISESDGEETCSPPSASKARNTRKSRSNKTKKQDTPGKENSDEPFFTFMENLQKNEENSLRDC